jgi:hypothetical protein
MQTFSRWETPFDRTDSLRHTMGSLRAYVSTIYTVLLPTYSTLPFAVTQIGVSEGVSMDFLSQQSVFGLSCALRFRDTVGKSVWFLPAPDLIHEGANSAYRAIRPCRPTLRGTASPPMEEYHYGLLHRSVPIGSALQPVIESFHESDTVAQSTTHDKDMHNLVTNPHNVKRSEIRAPYIAAPEPLSRPSLMK